VDHNLQALLISAAVGLLVGLGVAVARSERIRRHGFLGALFRQMSGHSGYRG
jgi:hypothetical protein